MKKVAVWVLIFTLLLCGCEKKQTVGVCLRQTDTYLSQQLQTQLRQNLEAAGYGVKMGDARRDQAVQNAQLARMMKENADVWIVEPVLTAQASKIANMAQEGDIPLIFLNYPSEASVPQSRQQASFVGSDYTQAGAMQWEMAANGDQNGDGVVSYLLLGGPENHIDASAWAECTEQLPNGDCLTLEHGDWSRESGQGITARALGKYGKSLEAILCCGAEMTLGALDAIRFDGRTDICLVGMGANEALLEGIKCGEITGTVCPDIPSLAEYLTEAVGCSLTGQPVENNRKLPLITITAENAEYLSNR